MNWAFIQYNLAAVALLATFWLLIARRISGAVNGYAVQSMLLGAICLAAYVYSGLWHLLILAASTVLIKGIAIPMVLRRQVGSIVYERRETAYYVGFPTALLIGAALSITGFVAGNRMELVVVGVLGEPVLDVAIAVILIGFFMTFARRDAAMQLTGLLVAENGLLLLGLVIGSGLPLLIDFALFLDVLVGAVVMGFLIARMHETVESTDSSELSRLRG